MIKTAPFTFATLVLLIMLASCNEPAKTDIPEQSQTDTTSLPTPVKVLQKMDTTFEENGTSLKKVVQQYENDTLFRVWNYDNGKLNGESYSYHPDGKPFSLHTYVNGKKSGPYKTWHSNGQVYMEGQWKDDVPVGIWNFYNEAGELMKEIDSDKNPIQVEPDSLKK